MRGLRRRRILGFVPTVVAALLAGEAGAATFDREFAYTRFFKGNTHAHSYKSDGLDPLDDVIRWYRDGGHGYDFLVVSEHNRVIKRFTDAHGRGTSIGDFDTADFITIPGEEVSHYAPPWLSFRSQKAKQGRRASKSSTQVHVNGLCLSRSIPGKRFKNVKLALGSAIQEIGKQKGALAQINHPNYTWALSTATLLEAGKGAALIEIANQHPLVRNEGDAAHADVETKWDSLLTAGLRIFGVASDDVHALDDPENGRSAGKGWVEVASTQLTPAKVCAALENGAFYSSTGVRLERVEARNGQYTVQVSGPPAADAYRIEFIGAKGHVLAESVGLSGTYTANGGEGYVRARVTRQRDGRRAWTQPVWVK